MKHFLNLTSIVINKLHITEIVKKPGKYYIYMSNSSVNGGFLFSYGEIFTTHNIIEICKFTNREDYKNVTELIKNIK